MTCSPLLRPPAAAERAGEPPVWVHGDDGWAQFLRFVLVGGASTAFYALLYVSLSGLGYLPAHLVATTISTVLVNETHRRLTFRAEDRVPWLTAQWEAGSVAVIGLISTSVALTWLESVAGTAPIWLQIALVAAVTAVIGMLRFVALRWIFRPHSSISG